MVGSSAQVPSDEDVRKTLWSAGQRRALGLAQLGELSSARQALEGAAVAPGDEKTWKALSDETKRPRTIRGTLWKMKFSQWFLLILWSWTSS